MARRAEQLTRMPPSILKEAERAAQELAGLIVDTAAEDLASGGRGRDSDPARPRLTPPRQFAAGGTAPHDAVVDARQSGRLLASMMAALQDGSLSKLAFNAQSAAVRDAVRAAGDTRLADEYEAASNAVSAAMDRLAALKDTLAGATEEAAALERQLAEAESALAALEPDSPQYQAAMQSRDALRDALTAAKTKLDGIKNSVRQQQDHVLALQKKADGLLERANLQGTDLPNAAVKKDTSNIARLLTLMMQLGELMLNTGETRSETQQKLLEVQQDVRVKKLAKDAAKAETELAKIEAMNKAMGCIGKILGAVVTAVVVVGAAFTGGASLALAGIGLALMVADEIHQAVTGNSFMEQAMKPLMNLLQPLLQFVMDKVAGAMESLGVDAQTAKMVAMIAVSVAMAAAVVALAVTGAGSAIASAVSNVVGKLSSVLTKVLEKTIAKLIPEALKKSISQMAKQMSSAATRMFDSAIERLGLFSDLSSKQVYASNLGRVSAGVNFGKTVIDGGLEVGVQAANQQVARTMADVKFTMSELDLLNDMFASLLDQFKKTLNVSQEFFRHASDAIDQRTSTGAAITRAVRGARAA
ncbi:type III secretion system translocon subunit SctE [Xanthomonas theicola]|nr:type III secretion system translocon subunit SctE [Xanthomonas theicola]